MQLLLLGNLHMLRVVGHMQVAQPLMQKVMELHLLVRGLTQKAQLQLLWEILLTQRVAQQFQQETIHMRKDIKQYLQETIHMQKEIVLLP